MSLKGRVVAGDEELRLIAKIMRLLGKCSPESQARIKSYLVLRWMPQPKPQTAAELFGEGTHRCT